ncbi:MAG: bacteriochlorophyll 4-vinyl reductase [Pseudomonadota bacterium]
MVLVSETPLNTANQSQLSGRIGPNSVLQLEAALKEFGGAPAARSVFSLARLSHLLDDRPGDMVDEAIPRALFTTLFECLPRPKAAKIAHRAGELTGDYILKHRIPGAACRLLKALPPRFAAPLLLKAIQKHAWTFVGSGICGTSSGLPSKITIENNPLAMPNCAWHVGVFEALFQNLVSPATQIVHRRHCSATGDPICSFSIHTPPCHSEVKP